MGRLVSVIIFGKMIQVDVLNQMPKEMVINITQIISFEVKPALQIAVLRSTFIPHHVRLLGQ
jgi:hypothetical protein